VEGSGGGGGGGAFDADDWNRDTAYGPFHIHTYACCSLGIAMWDKEQAFWPNLQTFDMVSW